MPRKRLFSGIQPTGSLHIGNYFGAITNWLNLQDTFESFFCIVDYHALSGDFSPKTLARQTIDLTLDLLACGINPKKTTLFVQSQVPLHAELCWILSAFTSFGDLTRMHQFKVKSEQAGFIKAALFNYPILQAADILLYKASKVPVGEDQIQHLELANDIGGRFNHTIGKKYFPEISALLTEGARIMSLADPLAKMSKSLGEKHYVGLNEKDETIWAKVRSAITDVGLQKGGVLSPGVKNLFTILALSIKNTPQSSLGQKKVEELRNLQASGSLKYAELKETVFQALKEMITPIREQRSNLTTKDATEFLQLGREKALSVAEKVLKEIRSLVGFLPA